MYDCFVSGGGDVCGLSCYNPNPGSIITRIIHTSSCLNAAKARSWPFFTLRQTTLLLKVRGEQCRLIESTGTRIRPHYDFDLGSFHTRKKIRMHLYKN